MTVAVRDPSGLSGVVLSMSAPALHLLALMDGSNTLAEIQHRFYTTFGQSVSSETISKLLSHLDEAHLLVNERFDAHYEKLLTAYRSDGVRRMATAAELGILDDSGKIFAEMLAGETAVAVHGLVRGVIAPHLDYPRGRPCYASAYSILRGRQAPDRVVILGTNHFGRSMSVVATGNDFETPLGRTAVDRDFIDRLEKSCGDLRRFELDHMREHSVELQVAFVQYLFGADRVELVPVLCPDPCGPTGLAPADDVGVDLDTFARVLRDLTDQDDDINTLFIAGADMSHLGAPFGDDRVLDEVYLEKVRARDRRILDWLEVNNPTAFLSGIAETGNPTNVCSAGCMYLIRSILDDASAHILRYHQAVDLDQQCCVTCAAVAFIEEGV